MKTLSSFVLAGLVAAGCSSAPAGPDPVPGIQTLALASGIRIHNGDTEDRWYILFDEATAAVVDLSFDPAMPDAWTRIPAGESRTVPWSAVVGLEPGTRAIVVHSWIRSVPREVGGGIQWGAEGLVTRTIRL